MDRKLVAVFAAFAVVGVAALAATGVLALNGDPAVTGPRYGQDVQAQLEQAFQDRDYDSWVRIREENKLPTKGRIFQIINKDNFAKFAQLHEAIEAGDETTAQQLREELGLGCGQTINGKNGVCSCAAGIPCGEGSACGGDCGGSCGIGTGTCGSGAGCAGTCDGNGSCGASGCGTVSASGKEKGCGCGS